jgi:alpha-aminoadipate carrier protein LysW
VPTGTCPECDADVHVDMDTDKGEIVSCEECGTELEVVGLDPVELDIVEEEAYDEDEDEDEYSDCPLSICRFPNSSLVFGFEFF